MRYIISDLHLGHENIIRYCERPFSSLAEMHAEMTERWNQTVDEGDTVIVVGDILGAGDDAAGREAIESLNGDILLVRGNHDSFGHNAPFHVVEQCTIQHGRYTFYVEHEPDSRGGPWWLIHGHVHNNDLVTYPFIHNGAAQVNVSAELLDYTPLAMDELVWLLDKKEDYRTINECPERIN